jgi:hypothetical protein
MPSIEKEADITGSDWFNQMPVKGCQDVVPGRFCIFEDPSAFILLTLWSPFAHPRHLRRMVTASIDLIVDQHQSLPIHCPL